jgi:hypothetical protein
MDHFDQHDCDHEEAARNDREQHRPQVAVPGGAVIEGHGKRLDLIQADDGEADSHRPHPMFPGKDPEEAPEHARMTLQFRRFVRCRDGIGIDSLAAGILDSQRKPDRCRHATLRVPSKIDFTLAWIQGVQPRSGVRQSNPFPGFVAKAQPIVGDLDDQCAALLPRGDRDRTADAFGPDAVLEGVLDKGA